MKWALRILDVDAEPVASRPAGRYWTLVNEHGEHFAYWHPTAAGWRQAWQMIDWLRDHRGLT